MSSGDVLSRRLCTLAVVVSTTLCMTLAPVLAAEPEPSDVRSPTTEQAPPLDIGDGSDAPPPPVTTGPATGPVIPAVPNPQDPRTTPVAPQPPTSPTVGEQLEQPLDPTEKTLALADAARTGQAVEILSARTETTTVTALPDGSLTTKTSPVPIRVRDGQGWADIDLDLVSSDGRLEPETSATDLTLSAGNDSTMADLNSGSRGLAFGYISKLPTPVVAGNVATYRLAPSVDLVVEATRLGFTQKFMIKQRPTEGRTYRIPLRLKGLTMSELPNGELQLKDSAGNVVSTAPQPRMWGAAINPRTDEPLRSAPLDVQIVSTTAGQELRISAPAGFLTDPSVTLPITVDPLQNLAAQGDIWVQEGFNSSQNGSTELRAGSFDGGATRARSYLKFNVTPVVGDTINSASLSLWNFHSFSCNARGVRAYALTTNFTTTTNWATQPSYTLTDGGSGSFANGYASSCPAAYGNIGITELVRGWASGERVNRGLAVVADNEQDSFGWKKFNSGNAAQFPPVLAVNSTPSATVPSAPRSVAATAGNAFATVTWAAPATTGGSAITSYLVDRYDLDAGNSRVQVSVGATARSYTSTGLINGHRYLYKITARNAQGNSAPGTAADDVTPATNPGPPTNVIAVGSKGRVDLTWTPPANNGGAAVEEYSFYIYDANNQIIGALGATGPAATVLNLTPGASYRFEVFAKNRVGFSAPSVKSNLALAASPAGPPTNVVATMSGSNAVVTWNAPVDNGGLPILQYFVVSYDAATNQLAGSGVVTSPTVTVPLPNSLFEYYFVVTAQTSYPVNSGFGASSARSNNVTGATCSSDFNALWIPRLTDVGFAATQLTGVSQAILNEGYHGLSEPLRKVIANCLTLTDLANRFPGVTFDPRELAEIQAEVFRFIFAPLTVPKDDQTTLLDDTIGNLQNLAGALPAAVREALQQAASKLVTPLGAATAPLGDLSTGLNDLTQSVLDGRGGTPLLPVPALPASLLGQLAGTAVGLTTSTSDLINQTGAKVGLGPVTQPVFGDLVPAVLQTLFYRLCYESPTVTATCTGPLLPLVPTTLDVTGDGTQDVQATVSVLPLGGVTLQYKLDRLASSEKAGTPLRTHVWVSYDPATTSQRFKFGYDGFRRGSTLSDSTDTAVTLPNPAGLATGKFDVNFDVTHTGATGPAWALTTGFSTVGADGSESSPAGVSARFAPVPSNLNGVVSVDTGADGLTGPKFQLTSNVSTPTQLDAVAVSRVARADGVVGQTERQIVVDRVPARVDFTLQRPASSQAVTSVVLNNSDVVASVRFLDRSTPDLNQTNRYNQTRASATNVPANVTVSGNLDGLRGLLDISGPTTGLNSIAFEQTSVDQPGMPGLIKALTVDAAGLPRILHIDGGRTGADGVDVNYSSPTGRLVSLSVGLLDRDRSLLGKLVATDLPQAVTINKPVGMRTAVVDAPGGTGNLDLGLTIGNIGILRQTQEHATLNIANGNVGLSVVVSKLKKLDLTQTGRKLDADVQFTAGGSDLVLGALIDARINVAVVVTARPAHVNVSADGDARTARYQTFGTVVPRIAAYVTDKLTGPSLYFEVNQVPSDVRFEVPGTQPLTVKLSSDLPTGRATGWFSPNFVQTLRTDVDPHIIGSVSSIPGEITASYNATTRRFDYNASAPIVDLVLSARGGWLGIAPEVIAAVAVKQVPRIFYAAFTDGVDINGVTGPIGPITVLATNHRQVTQLPGVHLSLRVRASSGQVDASVHLPAVSRAQWNGATDGLHLKLNASITGAINLLGDVRLPAPGGTGDELTAYAAVKLENIPSQLDITNVNNKITVKANVGLSIDVDARLGWTAALSSEPAAPWYRGLSVTDARCTGGQAGCRPASQFGCIGNECFGLQARLSLRGLPTEVIIDAKMRKVDIMGLNATADGKIEGRIELKYLLGVYADAYFTQSGITAATDLHLGPITTTGGPGGRSSLSAPIHNSRSLGELRLNARLGRSTDPWSVGAGFTLSNIPADAVLRTEFGDAMTIDLSLSQQVASLEVNADLRDGTIKAAASAGLKQVPALDTRIYVTDAKPVDRDGSSVFTPRFSYTASGDTLDGFVTAEGQLLFGSNPSLELRKANLGFTNLGRQASISIDGSEATENKRVTVDSLPRTGQLWVGADVSVKNFTKRFDIDEKLKTGRTDVPGLPFDLVDEEYGRLVVEGNAEIREISSKAMITLNNVGRMEAKTGLAFLSLGVSGEFDGMDLSLENPFLNLNVDGSVRVKKRPYYSFTRDYYRRDLKAQGVYQNVLFNVLDSPRKEDGGKQSERAVCLRFDVAGFLVPAGSLELKTWPAPNSRFVNGFHLGATTDSVPPWVISYLNPVEVSGVDANGNPTYTSALPPRLVDIAASQLTPHKIPGNDSMNPKIDPSLKFSTDCS